MLPPIVLPDPCLSETLDPKDFEIATRVMSAASDLVAVRPGKAATDRRRAREMSFNPAAAPWRRNLGSFRQT